MIKSNGNRTLYFAYGSNIPSPEMRGRCPGARDPRPATLHGYRLEFAGCADVQPREGASVEGVVWSVNDSDLRSLDGYEGAGYNPWSRDGFYRRAWCHVVLRDGRRVRALVYLMNEPERRQHLPSEYYVRCIARGYVEFGLDTAPLVDAVTRIQDSLTGQKLVEDVKGRWRPADADPYVPRGRRRRARKAARKVAHRRAVARLAAGYPAPHAEQPYTPAVFDPGYVDEVPVGFSEVAEGDDARAVAKRFLIGEGMLAWEAEARLVEAEEWADAVGEVCDLEAYLAAATPRHHVMTLGELYEQEAAARFA